MSKESLQKAVDLAGGQAHLGRGIRERIEGSKIGQVHVWGWLNSVKIEVPPAEVVLPIADGSGECVYCGDVAVVCGPAVELEPWLEGGR